MIIEQSVVFAIESGYGDLRPSEQKAADYILSHLKQVSELSIDQLAQNAKVSQPTIMRMLKALGYKGYKVFKYAIVRDFAQKQLPDRQIYQAAVSQGGKVADVPANIVAAATDLLEHSMKSISIKTFEQVIEAMGKANTIDIYSVENSNATAGDLATKLLYLGLKCRAFNDPYLQQISAAGLCSGDVAVGISYSGASKVTVDALKIAKKSGATTIAITNFQNTPIEAYTDLLVCPTQDQIFYGNDIFSRLTQTLIVDMIYTGLLTSDYETYRARLDKNSRIISDKSCSIELCHP